jgi:hypothetical protein
MKLVAKITSSQETMDIDGVDKPKKIKNGFLCDITYKINEWVDLPKGVVDAQDKVFLINISEKGGTCGDKIYAQIVTGNSSKPLKPFFIPRKTIIPCGDHAFFSVPEKCFSIETFDGEDIRIKENTIEIDETNSKARLSSVEIYSGSVETIPEDHIRFKKAAEICLDKANCPNCTFIYYFNDPSSNKLAA